MENLRDEWIAFLRRIADPVLDALGKRELKRSMPVETTTEEDRSLCSHMEAFGRLLCGLAPWLELAPDGTAEGINSPQMILPKVVCGRSMRRRFGVRLPQPWIPGHPIISGARKLSRIRSFWWIPLFLPTDFSAPRMN